jgi:predicted hydrolase (HD superfamily)
MNDNNPPRDALVAQLLTRSVIVEHTVVERVPEILKANDVPQKVIDAVLQTVEPVFKLQQETEKEVVSALQAVPLIG